MLLSSLEIIVNLCCIKTRYGIIYFLKAAASLLVK